MSLSERGSVLIIILLGALTTISPFSIDMYLPAFPQIAADLNSTVAKVSLSVSSYFIGLAVGQLFYGPLLDRYGRKLPLYAGLGIFIFDSIGCLFSKNVETLVSFRFVQALGGCSAQVASMAMVRDFFPVKESAKVFSLLILILGVSPLFAPTVGSVIAVTLGWQWVFILLTLIVVVIVTAIFFKLPEAHTPDKTISLRMKPIMAGFGDILKNTQFHTYALAGAFSFAGLFAYVAGSPIIFMGMFHLGAAAYGSVFALLSVGFIGGSQFNIFLLTKFSNERIFKTALAAQTLIAGIFLAGTLTHSLGLVATIIFLFGVLSCSGITYPNAAALALAPFSKTAGSASALLGFLQTGIAALISTLIGILNAHTSLPVVTIIAITSLAGLIILTVSQKIYARG